MSLLFKEIVSNKKIFELNSADYNFINYRLLQLQIHKMQSSQQKMISIYLRTYDKKARQCSIERLTKKRNICNLIQRRIKYPHQKIIVFYKGKLIINNQKQFTSTSDQLIYLQDKQILHVLSIENIMRVNLNLNIKQIIKFKQNKEFKEFKINCDSNTYIGEFYQKQVKNLLYQNQDKSLKVKIGSIIQLVGKPVFIYTGRVLKFNQSFIEQYVEDQSQILCMFPNEVNKENLFKSIITPNLSQQVIIDICGSNNQKQDENLQLLQNQNKEVSKLQSQSQKPFSPATTQLQKIKDVQSQAVKKKEQNVEIIYQIKVQLQDKEDKSDQNFIIQNQENKLVDVEQANQNKQLNQLNNTSQLKSDENCHSVNIYQQHDTQQNIANQNNQFQEKIISQSQPQNYQNNSLSFQKKNNQIQIQTMASEKFKQLKNQRHFSQNYTFDSSHEENLLKKQQQQIQEQFCQKKQDNFSEDLQQYQNQMRTQSDCSNQQIEPQGYIPQIKFVEGDLLYTAQIDMKKKVPLMDLLAYQYHDLLCQNLQEFVEEFGNICINYDASNQFVKI